MGNAIAVGILRSDTLFCFPKTTECWAYPNHGGVRSQRAWRTVEKGEEECEMRRRKEDFLE